ncbi:hypothetical protein KQ941_03315 [Paenibacillus xylanexedens]|uniref:hypothetical protein n=1 Tax=Paenibacillus xylanexedens TaxID=528191 RepID=UPI001F47B88E|nr:hypothetical protein [Paenibacillus xylanexedens]MCF7753460.1 hypothetical protein [Paenibacillus xylanexedens]
MAVAGTEQSIYTPSQAVIKRNSGVLYTYLSSTDYSNRTKARSSYDPERAGQQHNSGVLYTYAQGPYRSNATRSLSRYTSKSSGKTGQLKLEGIQYQFQFGKLHHLTSENPSEQNIYSIWGYDQEDLPQYYTGRLMLTDTHGVIVSHSKESNVFGNTGSLPLHNTPETRFIGRMVIRGLHGSLTKQANGGWKYVTKIMLPSSASYKGVTRPLIAGKRTLASSEGTTIQYIVRHLHGNKMNMFEGHLSGQGGNIDPTVPTTILPRRYPTTYIPVRRRSGQ